MSDRHWDVIESALREDYARIEKYMDKWQYMSPVQERRLSELARIDAALAFVREQKAAAWEPLSDDIEIQDVERNTWLSVERGGALISMSRHDTEDDPIAHDLFEVGLPPSVRLCRKQGAHR